MPQQSATANLDLHSDQPFGRDPAKVCNNPEVVTTLTAIAIQKMQFFGALYATKVPPPEGFFLDETAANLATVTMTSFDKDTILLKCEGDFTIELVPNAAESISSKASLLFPSTKTEHIDYEVQPLADRTDIVIKWSQAQAQASDYGALGFGVISAWEKRQDANGKGEPANVADTSSDTP